jgi:hypothetical protein
MASGQALIRRPGFGHGTFLQNHRQGIHFSVHLCYAFYVRQHHHPARYLIFTNGFGKSRHTLLPKRGFYVHWSPLLMKIAFMTLL